MSEGVSLLGSMYAAVRALQIYPPGNDAVLGAIAECDELAKAVCTAEGGLSIWTAGHHLYVNDLRIRLDLSDYATVAAFRELIETHGIGRITVDPGVRSEDWTVFLGLLAPARTEETDAPARLLEIQEQLAQAEVTHITLAPPLPLFETGEAESSAARRTYAVSVNALKDLMSNPVMGAAIAGRRAERTVLGIVDQVLADKMSMLGMLTLRDYDDHTYVHSVNVAILSVALGEFVGFDHQQLFELGFAALFHDIGKVFIANNLLNKKGWLNDEEWRQMAQHPDFGFLMLFNVSGFPEPPYRAMIAVYEHHMKVDLSGYPRVIRRRRQGLFAKIIAIVESYDAAISEFNKEFVPASPHDVIRQLRQAEEGTYDPVLVKAFINLMGLYPVGTLVILDTGELAVVVSRSTEPDALGFPIVRLISDPTGKRLGDGPIVDLMHPDPRPGAPQRSIARSADPRRYGIKVSDFVA